MKRGGVIHELEKVVDITPGPTVKVRTDKATYTTKKLVLAPGWQWQGTSPVSDVFLVPKRRLAETALGDSRFACEPVVALRCVFRFRSTSPWGGFF